MGSRRIIEIDSIQKLETETEKVEKFYIYGAGKIGLLIYFCTLKMNKKPFRFLVSEKYCSYYQDIELYIEEYVEEKIEKDDGIIIAVTEMWRQEIEENLRGSKANIFLICDAFINDNYFLYENKIEKICFEENLKKYINAEGERFRNHFNNINFKDQDFLVKWNRLIRNLDYNSIHNLLLSLYRIQIVKNTNKKELDIFDEKEKEKRLTIGYYLRDNLFQMEEDVWACDGRLLPRNDFRPEIFGEELGMSNISDIKKYENKDILDIGAYIGDSALILSEKTKGKVYAFDPIEEHIQLIKRTAELNSAKIYPVHTLVGNMDGDIDMYVGEQEYVSGMILQSDINYIGRTKSKITKIDTFCENQNIRVGIIKIHAEGNEQDVLLGAEHIIKTQSPVIIVDINHSESDFWNIKPLIESMNSEYQFTVFKGSNGMVMHGLKLIAECR